METSAKEYFKTFAPVPLAKLGKGHINSNSNLGNWDEGLSLWRELEFRASSNQYRHAS